MDTELKPFDIEETTVSLREELTRKDEEIKALNDLVDALYSSEAQRGNLIISLIFNKTDCTLQKYTSSQNQVTAALAQLDKVRKRKKGKV